MQISPLSPSLLTVGSPAERITQDSNLPDGEKVRELSRQFEAVLLRQILANARKSVVKSDLTPEAAGSDVYDDLVTSQLADAISRSGSFGFGRSLERELTRQLNSESAEGGDR